MTVFSSKRTQFFYRSEFPNFKDIPQSMLFRVPVWLNHNIMSSKRIKLFRGNVIKIKFLSVRNIFISIFVQIEIGESIKWIRSGIFLWENLFQKISVLLKWTNSFLPSIRPTPNQHNFLWMNPHSCLYIFDD